MLRANEKKSRELVAYVFALAVEMVNFGRRNRQRVASERSDIFDCRLLTGCNQLQGFGLQKIQLRVDGRMIERRK
jgi:hypothetical protein